MSMHINPDTIVCGEFGGLEPACADWRDQQAYWEDFNARFFQSNGLSYGTQNSNVTAWLQAEDRAPFAAMVGALLPELQKRTDLGDIDLVLLAHWMPDLHLGTSVTNFALQQLGLADGFGFAISDRGKSAPFFALQCAERYLRNGRKRALLMVMDQKHLLYQSDLVDQLQPANSASLMVLDSTIQSGLRFDGYNRQVAVASNEVEGSIADVCKTKGLKRADVTVIADPDLADLLAGSGPTKTQDPRLLCSAPFAQLTAQRDVVSTVLLASYEEGDLITVCLRQDADEGAV